MMNISVLYFNLPARPATEFRTEAELTLMVRV